jgi:predicted AAA+ superfamily ATPase
MPIRSLESVEMASNDKEALVADMQEYIYGKERYRGCCMPWRCGYLLYGPPGIGESSLITALVPHFQLAVSSITSSSNIDGQALVTLFQRVSQTNTIILLFGCHTTDPDVQEQLRSLPDSFAKKILENSSRLLQSRNSCHAIARRERKPSRRLIHGS